MTIEVYLTKYDLSNVNNAGSAYVLTNACIKTVDIPMPDDIKRLLNDGYAIANVRVKEEGVSNYGYKLS